MSKGKIFPRVMIEIGSTGTNTTTMLRGSLLNAQEDGAFARGANIAYIAMKL